MRKPAKAKSLIVDNNLQGATAFAKSIKKTYKEVKELINNGDEIEIICRKIKVDYSEIRKLFTKQDNYEDGLLLCEAIELPYTIIESNYTISIESDFYNNSWMRDTMNKKAFIAGAKIKRDIIATGLEPPEFNDDEIKYFNFTSTGNLINAPKTIYNIDIKSAYANVLNNHALIIPSTFQYMQRLTKKDRLACVGMLAANKDIYECLGDQELSYRKEVKETKNWFFFCVHRINKIMQKIADEIGDDFLCYWVDGIFFNNEKHAVKIGKILFELGYKYSFDICTEFEYSNINNQEKIRYLKGNKELKVLSMPKPINEVDKFLLNFLQL